MSEMRKMWTGEYHRADGSDFEAKITGHHEGPLTFHKHQYQIEVTHDSGRMAHYRVRGYPDGASVVCNLVDADETFVHPEAMASITKAMSLSTPALIEWDGYVD